MTYFLLAHDLMSRGHGHNFRFFTGWVKHKPNFEATAASSPLNFRFETKPRAEAEKARTPRRLRRKLVVVEVRDTSMSTLPASDGRLGGRGERR